MLNKYGTEDLNKVIQKKLSSLKLIIADVDGTLTDGYKYYSDQGQAMKRFNVKDGMGAVLLEKNGIMTALLTTDKSGIVPARAKDMRIVDMIGGSRDKKRDFLKLCENLKVIPSEAAMVGDDYNDLHAFEVAGLNICPRDSHPKVVSRAEIVLKAKGGEGVLREIADMVFNAKGIDPELEYEW